LFFTGDERGDTAILKRAFYDGRFKAGFEPRNSD
jgi:hypothetical protein